jgi:hypothetical protein
MHKALGLIPSPNKEGKERWREGEAGSLRAERTSKLLQQFMMSPKAVISPKLE